MPGEKPTPLHAQHLALGAKMVPFAGFSMPVQYSGIRREHEAVRRAVGLFDVSHMGNALVSGPGAGDFLDRVTVNNVGRLDRMDVQYSAMCNPEGGVVDDVVVFRLDGDDAYMLVVNAANRDKDLAWLRRFSPPGVRVEDAGDRLAILSLQGPKAAELAGKLARADLGGLGYYKAMRVEIGGWPMVISRTGYTGEDGFEFFPESADAPALWQALLDAGNRYGILPIGLGARDTLRLEAGYSLYGHELSETTNLVEAGLSWIIDFAKGDFVGKAPLLAVKENGPGRKLIGLEMLERAIPREGCTLERDGVEAGRVTSGTLSPTLEKGIALAYAPAEWAALGEGLNVVIRGRKLPARVVKRTFYKRRKIGD